MNTVSHIRATLTEAFADAERRVASSWTKGALARLASGEPCRALDPGAVYFSLSGALEVATEHAAVLRSVAFMALRWETVGMSFKEQGAPAGLLWLLDALAIQEWQNEPTRTHHEAMQVLRLASLRMQGRNDLPPPPLGKLDLNLHLFEPTLPREEEFRLNYFGWLGLNHPLPQFVSGV